MTLSYNLFSKSIFIKLLILNKGYFIIKPYCRCFAAFKSSAEYNSRICDSGTRISNFRHGNLPPYGLRVFTADKFVTYYQETGKYKFLFFIVLNLFCKTDNTMNPLLLSFNSTVII